MPADADPGDFETDLKPLWLRSLAGDEAAYRAALSRIATRLRSYLARRMRGVPDDMEDLVQETLLALHLQRGTYDPTLPVSAWVLAIAQHKLVDLWRRRGRRDALHEPLDGIDETLLPTAVAESHARRDLRKLLGELPEAQRTAILLTKVEGLSVAEAATRTGASESAVKVQVHRGLKRLATRVKDRP
jgi:RNA polymerase sigma-70 factor (ECF subfamily)